MSKLKYNLKKLRNPRDKRLAIEHMSIDELCEQFDHIEYEVVGNRTPPEAYLIHYSLKSIVGIDDEQNPVFGKKHTAEITLPRNYPMEPAKCYMKTDIWHPNIKSDGRHKGRICGNTSGFGKNYSLYLLIQRIGEILAYKNYHAENTPPFPEDEKVARWVREYAEPKELVDKEKGILRDKPVEEKPPVVEPVIEEKPPVDETPPVINEEPPIDEPPKEEPKEPKRKFIKLKINRDKPKTPPPPPPRRIKKIKIKRD